MRALHPGSRPPADRGAQALSQPEAARIGHFFPVTIFLLLTKIMTPRDPLFSRAPPFVESPEFHVHVPSPIVSSFVACDKPESTCAHFRERKHSAFEVTTSLLG